MIKLIEKYPIASIVIFGLLMLLPNLDAMVLTIMEARDYVTAHEMVVDGHWLQTTMNGIARYEKPPLPTWLSAFSGMLFGIHSLFALRLPAALMIVFSGIFTYKLSIKFNFSVERSLINSFILLTSFYVIAIIIEAPWDIFTHGFTLASIYYFIDILKDDKVALKNVIWSGLFLGFSFLSKGPIGFYALFLPFLFSYIYFFGIKNAKAKIKYLLAFLIIFILIGGSWHLFIEVVDSSRLNEITEHEAENWESYNVRPFYYYWSFVIQSGIWTFFSLVALWYPYLKKKVKQQKEYKFTILWILATLILLSIVPEKKSRYLVPILFPLALNTGFYLEYLLKSFTSIKSTLEKSVVYFNFIVFGAIAIIIPFGISFIFYNSPNFDFLTFLPFFLLLIFVGFNLFKSLFNKNIKKAFYFKIIFMGLIVSLGLPIVKLLNNNPSYNGISSLHQIEHNYHLKSYFYKEIAPELLWYYQGKIEKFKSIKSVKNDSIGLLINVDDSNILKNFSTDYKVVKLKDFNANYFKKERNRLKFDYYLITKNNYFNN
ncbi:MAG: glycosyltransferase family 39 protein [Bacteroidetes bacterium]|nr:glycosyltransferase family 39 protein [Bacteroidota bacterium]